MQLFNPLNGIIDRGTLQGGVHNEETCLNCSDAVIISWKYLKNADDNLQKELSNIAETFKFSE